MLKRYVIGFGVAVALGAAIYSYGQMQHRAGYQARERQAMLEMAELNEIARAKEQMLIAEQAARDKIQFEEYQDAQKTIANLRADIASGRKRLSVAINKAAVCAGQGATTSGVDDGTARAEFDREAADRIIGIVAEGDRAIRQLNALQDWAEMIVGEQ
ncbi:lysis system i-spanin subunit Rz [Oligella urethralis]|uniref:lysis system i-spanin subunit Rz n=1 Tax=Oligella urethralis TaxID=90245 RepID=UPI00288C5EC1|nr:lysis system i-spanin subunit Rz [Oligella urethralis]